MEHLPVRAPGNSRGIVAIQGYRKNPTRFLLRALFHYDPGNARLGPMEHHQDFPRFSYQLAAFRVACDCILHHHVALPGHHSVHETDHFLSVEWLDDIVVSNKLQTDDLVDSFALSGYHDYRNV